MNETKLKNYLYTLTNSEKLYLKHIYHDYSNCTKTVHHNEDIVYQFELKEFIKSQNGGHFFIRKQSRFAPVPTHVTDAIELNYVYHGNSIHYINGKKIHLQEGDLILIDTNTTHAVDSPNFEDIIISININPDYFKNHFLNQLTSSSPLVKFLYHAISNSKNNNQYLLYRQQSSPQLHLLFQQLLIEEFEPQLLNLQVKSHYFQLILLELIRSFSVEVNGTSEDSHKLQLLLNVLEYVNKEYACVTLESCASIFGYNPTYFSHLIKTISGHNFKKIVQKKRLEVSRELLTMSTKSIQEIAHEVGYSNLNQYYKDFKQTYHTTPAFYRKHSELD